MTTIRVHVDLPADLWRALATKYDGEVGKALQALALRAARMEPQPVQVPEIVKPQGTAHSDGLGERDSKIKRYDRTTKRMARIRQLMGEGYTVAEIAADIGVSQSAVYQYQRRLACTPPTTEERVLGIEGLHRAGYTPSEIAGALNLQLPVVLAYIEGIKAAS